MPVIILSCIISYEDYPLGDPRRDSEFKTDDEPVKAGGDNYFF